MGIHSGAPYSRFPLNPEHRAPKFPKGSPEVQRGRRKAVRLEKGFLEKPEEILREKRQAIHLEKGFLEKEEKVATGKEKRRAIRISKHTKGNILPFLEGKKDHFDFSKILPELEKAAKKQEPSHYKNLPVHKPQYSGPKESPYGIVKGVLLQGTKTIENRPLKGLKGEFVVLEEGGFSQLPVYERDQTAGESQVMLTSEKIRQLQKYLREEGQGLIEAARAEKQTLQHEVQHGRFVYRFLINPHGKIYMEVGKQGKEGYERFIGEGFYKSVTRMALVATYTFNKTKDTRLLRGREKAVAFMKGGEEGDKKEIVKEAELNAWLSEERKRDPSKLAFIALARSKQFGESQVAVSSFADGGALDGFLEDFEVPRKMLYGLLADMAEGVKELHQLGIVHRDLKPDNFLIFDDGQGGPRAKVSDLGKALEMRKLSREDNFEPLPIAFTPPEIVEDPFSNLYTPKGDVFELGVTFALLLTGKNWRSENPLMKRTQEDNFEAKRNAAKLLHVDSIEEPYRGLVRSMLDVDPKKRPSIQEVVRLLRTA